MTLHDRITEGTVMKPRVMTRFEVMDLDFCSEKRSQEMCEYSQVKS
jgi:hypothetical protein